MKKVLGGILERIIEGLDVTSNGALKRLLMILLTMLVPVLNAKLGLGLKTEEVLAVILAGIAYVWQSGAKAKALAALHEWEEDAPAPKPAPAPVVAPAPAEAPAVTTGTPSNSDAPNAG